METGTEEAEVQREYKAEVVGPVRSSGKSAGPGRPELDLTETAVRAWMRQATI
jgi:hypothetical protein